MAIDNDMSYDEEEFEHQPDDEVGDLTASEDMDEYDNDAH